MSVAKTIKVIHIVPSMQLGGVEKGINLSIKKLNENFDYKVLTLTNDNTYYSKKDRNYFIFSKKRFVIISIISSLREIKKQNPDIIISSLWKSAIVSILFKKIYKKDVCLVAFIHSEKFFHKLDAFFLTAILKIANAIAADSLSTLKAIGSKAKFQNHCFEIPYIFSSNLKLQIQTDFSLVKFLYAGRLTEVKNLEATIDFFFEFKKIGIPFIFNIYGVGSEIYEQELKQRVEKFEMQNDILFKGLFQPNDTSLIYREHHFYIQFSKQEGMAMSVVDAMLNGVVPICTPVGEIKNYISHLRNGILVDKVTDFDCKTLCETLRNIIYDKLKYADLSQLAYNYFLHKKDYTISMEDMIHSLANKQK